VGELRGLSGSGGKYQGSSGSRYGDEGLLTGRMTSSGRSISRSCSERLLDIDRSVCCEGSARKVCQKSSPIVTPPSDAGESGSEKLRCCFQESSSEIRGSCCCNESSLLGISAFKVGESTGNGTSSDACGMITEELAGERTPCGSKVGELCRLSGRGGRYQGSSGSIYGDEGLLTGRTTSSGRRM